MSQNEEMLSEIWNAVSDLLLPDLDLSPQLDGILARDLGAFLIQFELLVHHEQPCELEMIEVDPFNVDEAYGATVPVTSHRPVWLRLVGEERWREGILEATRQSVGNDSNHTDIRWYTSL
jgi:hypothetical protein